MRRHNKLMESKLSLSDFDFKLPKHLIAQQPASPRNYARLLVYDRSLAQISDDYFYNLDKYLKKGSAIALNNSKVEKTRLLFEGMEVFVLEVIDSTTIRALVKPGRKFQKGQTVNLASSLSATVLAIDELGVRMLKLNCPIDDKRLDSFRHTPLPPYIKQDDSLDSAYQTVYAKPCGSKAAPTAGLHFSKAQLDALSTDHKLIYLTLHIGLGTFAPVKVDDISLHKMHAEDYSISSAAANDLNAAGHITAIGTTTVRILETAGRPFYASDDSTSIFITPGYKFKAVDSLVTNFHLPRSTLLMLVAALIG